MESMIVLPGLIDLSERILLYAPAALLPNRGDAIPFGGPSSAGFCRAPRVEPAVRNGPIRFFFNRIGGSAACGERR